MVQPVYMKNPTRMGTRAQEISPNKGAIMGQSSMKVSENQEFLSSERWKCSQSPSGAHHWIIHSIEMTCKYCKASKPVSPRSVGWPKPETGQVKSSR
jgi:hypothetical protein